MDLARLSPYRIVSMGRAPVTVAAGGSGHAALAARPDDIWQDEDPLPQIPEMAPNGAFGALPPQPVDGAGPRHDGGAASDPKSSIGSSSATFALWMAAGAIAGTGVSWTMDGATATGLVAGSALGAVAGWGWLRWTSPK